MNPSVYSSLLIDVLCAPSVGLLEAVCMGDGVEEFMMTLVSNSSHIPMKRLKPAPKALLTTSLPHG
jgi:hypothetical protein